MHDFTQQNSRKIDFKGEIPSQIRCQSKTAIIMSHPIIQSIYI